MKIEIEASIRWEQDGTDFSDEGPTRTIELLIADSNSERESSYPRNPKWVTCEELKAALFSTV